MPVTIYATTRPGRYDTRAIAKGKWLQQLASPSAAVAGVLQEPIDLDIKFHDSRLMVIQKILIKIQQ